uniref:DAGKc domain-containing protein n=1 Tax=Peronospora matthiolae TaxID=2874970 RepID=A0AAV1TSE1_9STRA
MSTTPQSTVLAPEASTIAPMADFKPSNTSSRPENLASVASLLAELQLNRVVPTLWCINSHKPARFVLTPLHCAVESVQNNKNETIELSWDDVLGAHVRSSDGKHIQESVDSVTDPDASFLLIVSACTCQSSFKPKSLKKRKAVEFSFQFTGKQLQQVRRLQQLMNFLSDPRNREVVQKVETLDDLEIRERSPRKYLVLVNPVSGPGRALQIYESKVAPIFEYANVKTEVKVMDHAQHATEVVMTMPLGVYDCVVAVGGDGSLYEIVQGLMKRADWNRAIRQPIGVIPGGSGNGLSHSICHRSGEEGKPVNAAYILAKGMPHDLDISSVRNGKETTYSFLSVGWASIADVDIGSEKLRMLGGLRFTVAFVNQLVFQRPEYPGKIWYLEEEEDQSSPLYFETHDPESTDRPKMNLVGEEGRGLPDNLHQQPGGANLQTADEKTGKGGKWKELGGHFRVVWAMNVSHAASDAYLAPSAELDDGFNYITFMDGSHPRKNLLSMMLAIETGEHVDKKGVQQVRTRAFKVMPDRADDLMCVDGELMDGPYLEAEVHRGLACIMAIPRRQSESKK